MSEANKRWVVALAVVIVLAIGLKAIWPGAFDSRDIEDEGHSSDTDFPVVVRVKGGMLEVASIKGTRNFPKATDPAILGRAFPYCRERASWTAPYKITYRVRLGEKWTLRYYNGTLIARVPDLEPSLPVPIQFEKLQKGARESCWFIPDQGTRDRALRSIGPELTKLAKSKKAKDFARPSARVTITEFLRTWAFNQKAYPDLRPDTKIKVYFPGE